MRRAWSMVSPQVQLTTSPLPTGCVRKGSSRRRRSCSKAYSSISLAIGRLLVRARNGLDPCALGSFWGRRRMGFVPWWGFVRIKRIIDACDCPSVAQAR
ncbi:hypothetical protein FQZ97_1158140 [compost metagenome]